MSDTNGAPQNGAVDDYDDDNNLAEIEAEMARLNGEDEDDEMTEMEAEMDRLNMMGSTGSTPFNSGKSAQSAGGGRGGGAYLPAGAVPSQNGVLSKHAAEFWFPECRNCPCCKGFKHGCSCCNGGTNTCTNASCNATEPVAGEKSTADALPPAPARHTPVVRQGSGGRGGVMPAGAMPTTSAGVLSPHAAEFWFPECRHCPCCKGFKHGCGCCNGGVNTCTNANCHATEPVAASSSSPPPAPAPAPRPAYTPSPRGPPISPSGGGASGQVCRFFLTGSCRFGAACNFVHPAGGQGAGSGAPPPMQSKTPCMYFRQGMCQFGTSCKFSHD